jgi:transcriptional regulator with XRE-family HTH domain
LTLSGQSEVMRIYNEPNQKAVELAHLLRRVRERSALNQSALAARLSWSQSKVSKIEKAKQRPSLDDVVAWLRQCSADASVEEDALRLEQESQREHNSWRERVRADQAVIQETYDEMAIGARLIRNLEVVYVPGLLQVGDYAYYPLAEAARLHEGSANSVQQAVEARLKRQNILSDQRRRFEFILHETALYIRPCPVNVMIHQLASLLEATYQPNVELGIMPFNQQLTEVPGGGFIAFDDSYVVVETLVEEIVYRAGSADTYFESWARIAEQALFGDDARVLIQRASERLFDK